MHLKRVQEAAKILPGSATSTGTGLSFDASHIVLEGDVTEVEIPLVDSQNSEDGRFKKPAIPASARQVRDFKALLQMMEESVATLQHE